MKEKLSRILFVLLLLGFFSAGIAGAEICIDLKGESYTNSLQGISLGSADIATRDKTVKLRCGVQGVLQGYNEDGSMSFQHTIACDDHSLFILDTHTFVQITGDCQDLERPGFIGSFEESSSMIGVDGPYKDWSGQAWITGTIECGWNDMEFDAQICGSEMPPPSLPEKKKK